MNRVILNLSNFLWGGAGLAVAAHSASSDISAVRPKEPQHGATSIAPISKQENSHKCTSSQRYMYPNKPTLASYSSDDKDADSFPESGFSSGFGSGWSSLNLEKRSCSESDSDSDIVRESLLKAVIECKPTEQEVDGAIVTLQNHSELYRHVLPDGYDEEKVDGYLSLVRKIVMDPILILEAKDNIVKGRKPILREREDNAWSELQKKYCCAICRDVLAAPVVLPCSHSFCGQCTSELFSACESEETEVVYPCPQCFTHVSREGANYARGYDDSIAEIVENIPGFEEEKSDWEIRRQTYLVSLKNGQNDHREEKQQKEESNPLDIAIAFAAIVLILIFTSRGFR